MELYYNDSYSLKTLDIFIKVIRYYLKLFDKNSITKYSITFLLLLTDTKMNISEIKIYIN